MPNGTGKSIVAPQIHRSKLLGASIMDPASQFVKQPLRSLSELDKSLLVPGINLDLITKYVIADDTGSLTSSSSIKQKLSPLSTIPRFSRDGGKGGYLNGQHLFIFDDTSSFETTSSSANGEWTGFVSSSVAIDKGLNGQHEKPIILQDGTGQYSDDAGRLRGFAPMTMGEEAFNKKMSGGGDRYALWPESSIIPVNETTAVVYASLIYDKVDMSSQNANFTYMGNTLLQITAGDSFGPSAERVVKLLFTKDEVPWGTLGGIRSWGSVGVGGRQGRVYLFGKVDQGVLLARTAPTDLADRSRYEYWNGKGWSGGMLPKDAVSYLIKSPVEDMDIFYSPRHLTFIMVYMNPFADNTIYYRFLNASAPIMPLYQDEGNEGADYVENIVKQPWSSQQKLYSIPKPDEGYAYSGSVHQGYFGKDDVTNGGRKMLLSWTVKTGVDAGTPRTGYELQTAVIEFD